MKTQNGQSVILIILERLLEKLPIRTFNPAPSFLAFYKKKYDIEGKNSNENSTTNRNVGDYTVGDYILSVSQIKCVFNINTKNNKKLHVTRSCFKNAKEKKYIKLNT